MNCILSVKRIHQAVEKMVESLDLGLAGSTTGFNIYAVVESYFTDLEKRKKSISCSTWSKMSAKK